jgi:ankyrin repeat protein
VCRTLLYQLYYLARKDENNVKLLEDCNKVFKNPKASKIGSAIAKSNKDEKLPEFADAFSTIAERLKLSIVIALDEVNSLSPKDQQELASKLKAVLTPSEEPTTGKIPIKVIVGCRSGTKFHNQVQPMAGLIQSLDIGGYNSTDIAKKLSDDLRHVPGLTEAEQEEATKAILDKAGPRFAYIDDIAIPFMREPFQRPLSRRLQFLPEGMNNIYNEALRRMGSNYIDLLRTALTWTLLAPQPPRVQEIMDAYHGTYNDQGLETEAMARSFEDTRFSRPAELEIEQLRDASGPFLRLEHESRTDDYFVNLQDPPRIREFCLHAVDDAALESHKDDEYCARCKGALSESKSLTVSPKEGHLALALTCLRHLNNPVFQRRATAADDVPLWSQSEDLERLKIEEHKAQSPEDGETSAEAPPAEDDCNSENDESSPEETEELTHDENNSTADNDPLDKLSTKSESNDHQDRENGDNDDSGYDSDKSLDDEDRGEINLAKALDSHNTEQADDVEVDVRQGRYELYFLTYHVRQAEELWTPEERATDSTWAELMKEFDYFVSGNHRFFIRWQKFDENIADDHGHLAPLHLAAYFGLTSWAQHLFSKGANPNELSGSPIAMSALQVAARKGKSRPMLKFLLENGADPNFDSAETLPAFHNWLLNDASMEAVQLLLKHGADPTVADKANMWTALHYFAWGAEDNVEVLETLLNHAINGVKPNINTLDDQKSSPLHVLLWRREVPKKLLQAFIDNDADVNSEDASSTRPLQAASVWGELETLRILSRGKSIKDIDDPDDDGDSALHQAVFGNHPNCLKFLIDLGANPNLQNKRKRVALHHAAWQGANDCVDILLANGAHLNVRDRHNRTPFFFACLGESIETPLLVLNALLEKKVPMAEINILTKQRRSPLRQAAGKGFEEVVDKLIKSAQAENDLSSLSINEPDTTKGMTALHRAAWFGKAGCVRLLIDANADVNIRDKNDKTALVLAYEQWALASHENAFEEILSLLIAGAPEAATDDAELVAICAINGSTRLLQQLSAMGTDLNRQDRYGWTPLELARKFNQEAAEQFLKQ